MLYLRVDAERGAKYVLEIAEGPESSNVGCETCSTNKTGSTSKAYTTG